MLGQVEGKFHNCIVSRSIASIAQVQENNRVKTERFIERKVKEKKTQI